MVSAADARARSRLRRRVLDWYAANGRPLAFRATADPWAILVSEVMAQQTQAARAAEAWSSFLAAYPTPAALATAPTAEVIRAWRGLGYNRRAISLQGAARAIVRDHDGAVPSDLESLLRLPGVGPYTARAVAALAFGRRVGAVDTNVRRVIGRAFLGSASPDPRVVQALADELAPPRRTREWTHALMDVGATRCRVRDPRCTACPLRTRCAWAATLGDPGQSSVTAGSPRGGIGSAPRTGSTPRSGPRRLAFRATSRWLRGRILDRLRDLDVGAWLTFDEPIGEHSTVALAAALAAMSRDGLVDLGSHPLVARLPAGSGDHAA